MSYGGADVAASEWVTPVGGPPPTRAGVTGAATGRKTAGETGGRTHSTPRLAHRTRLMKGLQLPICLHDHGEFTHHVRNVRAGNRIVTLVVPQSGIHPVADAAEARGRPSGLQGFRQHRAGGPPHRRAATGDAS